ncbi:hypothetical protein MUP79_07060 [Candidatus Bathyarchaeota archaeon]|nr:hypothetical protein [Candidatus Bathyarchaeota archaeon]
MTEKLLMQTDPGHVVKIYDDFFRRFPTMLELSKSKQSEIARAIRPIGFWRQRARHFKKMALAIEEEHHGVVPRNRKTLRSIFGIGEYTADAFLCFAYGEKRAAIDLNSRRVAQRLLFWPEQVPGDEELAGMMKRLIPPGMAREFNWGVIDFANLVCRRKPRCEVCFATDMCRYYRLEVMG